MTAISHIDHIAIVTDNLNESLRFFEDALGLSVSSIEELPDRGIRVAMLPIGQTRFELIEPLHNESEVSGFIKKRGPGLHHIALATSAIQQDMDALSAQQVVLTSPVPQPGAHDSQVVFVHPKSTKGVLLELVQPSSRD